MEILDEAPLEAARYIVFLRAEKPHSLHIHLVPVTAEVFSACLSTTNASEILRSHRLLLVEFGCEEVAAGRFVPFPPAGKGAALAWRHESNPPWVSPLGAHQPLRRYRPLLPTGLGV